MSIFNAFAPVDESEIQAILTHTNERKIPQPKTNLIWSLVVSCQKNELPCGWGRKHSTDPTLCGVLTSYRIWGLARCKQHVIEEIELKFSE
jgi:hypothetical protein